MEHILGSSPYLDSFQHPNSSMENILTCFRSPAAINVVLSNIVYAWRKHLQKISYGCGSFLEYRNFRDLKPETGFQMHILSFSCVATYHPQDLWLLYAGTCLECAAHT